MTAERASVNYEWQCEIFSQFGVAAQPRKGTRGEGLKTEEKFQNTTLRERVRATMAWTVVKCGRALFLYLRDFFIVHPSAFILHNCPP
jgi:hypothetical protein